MSNANAAGAGNFREQGGVRAETPRSALDRYDRRILAAMQEDARLTSDQLSARVHLSPSAVQRRLKRLRDERVIEAEVAIVQPLAVGRPISALVQVMLEHERSDTIDAIKRALRDEPSVMNAYHVTGESDFVLLVTAPSMEAYEDFTRRFIYALPGVRTFKTMVVMDRVKTGFALPIEP